MTPAANDPFDDVEVLAPETSGPDFADIAIHAIGRFPFSIAILTVLGVLGGFVAGAVQPNQFESSGKILVRLGVREQLTAETSIATEYAGRTGAVGLGDVVHLLLNPVLYERVAVAVGPRDILRRPDPTEGDGPETSMPARLLHRFQSWWMSKTTAPMPDEGVDSPNLIAAAAAVVGANASIMPSSRSNTLTISYTATSPELAQKVVQAYFEVLRGRHQEVFLAEHQLNFVEEQMNAAIEEAKQCSDEYARRMLETGVFDLETQRAALLTEIQATRAQVKEDGVRLASTERQLELMQIQIDRTEPELENPAPKTARIVNPLHSSLTNQLVTLTEELEKIQDNYAPGSEVFRSYESTLKPRIEGLRGELERTEPFLSDDEPAPVSVPNPFYEQLVVRRWSLEQEIEGIKVAQTLRQQMVVDAEARLLELANLAPEYEELERCVLRANARANQMVASHSRTEILGLMDRNEHMSNLIVTQDATLPLGKTGPKRIRSLGMGTAAGLFLGLGLAVLRLLLDPTVRYPESLEKTLGVRVLGAIRHERRWFWTGRKLRRTAARTG